MMTTAPPLPPAASQVNCGVAKRSDDIVTPYRAAEWKRLLEKCGLLQQFPDLPRKLKEGFLLGNLPPISRTYTPTNHLSARSRPDVIDAHIRDEVALGRFEGPYSRQQMEIRLGSCFRSAPMGAVDKAGDPGKFRIVRDSTYRGSVPGAVNDFCDSDDVPTE